VKTSDWDVVWSNVVALIKNFPTVCRMPPTHEEIWSIPDPPFGHNLCFRCPNGSCKPTLDIYIARYFQWYKALYNLMGFDLYNFFLKIRESIGLQFPKWEFTWKWECSFSHTFLHSQPLGSMKCDSWASLLAHTLASPCLAHKPKAKVAIANLTYGPPSFGHNLCFKCPNGSCEPTLEIYVPISFSMI
jgi:hypothetical protein